MKSAMKRFTASMLGFVMIFSMIPANVFAFDSNAFAYEDFFAVTARLVDENWSDDFFSVAMFTVGSPYMTVDGVQKMVDPELGTSPSIVGGRAMLPLNVLVDKADGDISIDAIRQTIIVDADDQQLEMRINSTEIFVDGNQEHMEAAPVTVDSQTMVCVLAVAGYLGFEAEWNPEDNQILLTRNFQTKRLIVQTSSQMSFSDLGATDIVRGPDGINLLQFETIHEAQEAYDALSASGSVVWVQPDFVLIPEFTMPTSYLYHDSLTNLPLTESDYVVCELTGVRINSLADVDLSGEYTYQNEWTNPNTLYLLERYGYIPQRDDEIVQPNEDDECYSCCDGHHHHASTRLPLPDDGDEFGIASAHLSWGVDAIGANRYAAYLVGRGLTTREIVVAVLDTGIDAGHPFFPSGRVLSGWCTFTNSTNVTDNNGHGTHVAGTVVDSTPGLNNIRILPVRVLNPSGTSATVGNGITWAASRSDVINMSLGGPNDPFLLARTAYAINTHGVIVVSAAGNDRRDAANVSPANCPISITVSATDSANRPATFTNWGAPVDIGAPGVGINAPIPGGGFASWNGTSMAAPHVAGAAAMYILANPSLTPAQVRAAFRSYVNVPTGWNTRYGTGILSLDNMGDHLNVSQSAWSPGATAANITVQVTSNVSWTANRGTATWLTVTPASGNGNGNLTISATANTGTISRSGTVTVSGGGITQTIAVTQLGTGADNTVRTNPIELTLNTPVQVDLTARDRMTRWYRFTAPSAGAFTFATSNCSTSHSWPKLENSAGVQMGNLYNLYGRNRTVTHSLTAGQQVYVRAEICWFCVTGGRGSFTFTVTAGTMKTITLDRAGGTGGSANVTLATVPTTLPTGLTPPTRAGFTFDGYWTAATGGSRVINPAMTSFVANVAGFTNASGQWTRTAAPTTLFARWIAIADDGSTRDRALTILLGAPTTVNLTTRANMSLWYRFTAPVAGTYTFRTSNETNNTVLSFARRTGSDIANASGRRTSTHTRTMTAGEAIYIRAEMWWSYSSTGSFTLTVTSGGGDVPVGGAISTRAQLSAMTMTGTYHLVNDIDLAGANWVPIGTQANPFRGTFDGRGHVIRNMTITGNVHRAGLFHRIGAGGIVRNLSMVDTTINTSGVNTISGIGIPAAGAIAARASDNSIISNVYSTGNSNISVTATSNTAVGGLIGVMNGLNITLSNSFNTGSVNGQTTSTNVAWVGGLVGLVNNIGTSAHINNSYNTGSLSAIGGFSDPGGGQTVNVGGIVGRATNATLSIVYNTGTISATGTGTVAAGGLFGNRAGTGTITNSFWNIDSAQIVNGVARANAAKLGVGAGTTGGASLTTAQMRVQGNFTGFNFTTIWNINSSINNGFPFLRMSEPPGTGSEITITPATPNFGSQPINYATRPTQTIAITNTGGTNVTMAALPTVPGWVLTPGVNWTTAFAPGATRTFTIRPDNGLPPGTHNPIITLTASGATAQIQPTFAVTVPANAIAGVVRASADGAGIANATATLVSMATGVRVATTTTNAHGAYWFTGIVNGTYRVVFTMAGRNARISDPIVVSANGHTVNRTDFTTGTATQRMMLVRIIDLPNPMPANTNVRLGTVNLTPLANSFGWWIGNYSSAGGTGTLTAVSSIGTFTPANRTVAAGSYVNNLFVTDFTHDPRLSFDVINTTANTITIQPNRPVGVIEWWSRIRLAPASAWSTWVSSTAATRVITGLEPATHYHIQTHFLSEGPIFNVITSPEPTGERVGDVVIVDPITRAGWTTQYRIRATGTTTWGNWQSSNRFDVAATVRSHEVQARFLANDTSTHATSSESAAITIVPEGVGTEFTLRVCNAAAEDGVATVQIAIEYNPGILGLTLNLEYDAAMVRLLPNFDVGDIFTDFMRSPNIDANPMLLSFFSEGLVNRYGNGTIITLEFEAREGVYGTTPITVTVQEVFEETFEVTLDYTIYNGSITIAPFIYGDVDGDGQVTMVDAILLRRYLLGYPLFSNPNLPIIRPVESTPRLLTVNLLPADVAPAFGAVNFVDVVRIQQYVSGMDVPLGAMNAMQIPFFDSAVQFTVTSELSGNYVYATVSLDENPGLAFMHLMLDFDSSLLMPVGVTQGSMSRFRFFQPVLSGNAVPLMFEPSVFGNVTETGTLATVRFRVIGDISSDSIPVWLGYEVVTDAGMTGMFMPTIFNATTVVFNNVEDDNAEDTNAEESYEEYYRGEYTPEYPINESTVDSVDSIEDSETDYILEESETDTAVELPLYPNLPEEDTEEDTEGNE